MTLSKSVALLCCLSLLLGLRGAQARMNIACSPFVYPCQCGLCPGVVNCKAKPNAECFCGTAQPGIYSHPSDSTRFWMCSMDAQAKTRYGVEVACPARLVFDPVVKVCTVPNAVTGVTEATASAKAPSKSHATGVMRSATAVATVERRSTARTP